MHTEALLLVYFELKSVLRVWEEPRRASSTFGLQLRCMDSSMPVGRSQASGGWEFCGAPSCF